MNTSALTVLRIPEFRNFITGRFLFTMALRMLSTLLAWWMYELTRDAFYIGMLGLAEAVPAISLALYAGFIIDKTEKRKLLLTTVLLYCVCSIALLATSINWFHQQFGVKLIIVFVYSIIFLSGIIRSFAGPSFSAIIASLVPRELLTTGSQVNSMGYLISSITGHAVTGFSIAYLHVQGTFFIIITLLIISSITLSRLSKKPPIMGAEKRTIEAVAEGLKYVLKTKEVLGALSLDLFAVLFGGAVAMVPVFAKDILHVGPIGFGWLNAASDIGSICMVISLTLAPLKRKQGLKLLLAVGGFGTCIIIFGLSKWYAVSFLALMISGTLDGVSVVVRSNIVQLKTPDALRGRVMSVNSMFINSSNEIGEFESGIMAKLMGNIVSVVFGGFMTILVVIVTAIKAPALKEMEY
ncbi:MAG: MFS transporter [Ferruginibacter sp.]